jgi:uncharacterized protein (TIGR03382 family)
MTPVEFALMAAATVLAFVPFTVGPPAAVALVALVFVWQRRRAGTPVPATTASSLEPR